MIQLDVDHWIDTRACYSDRWRKLRFNTSLPGTFKDLKNEIKYGKLTQFKAAILEELLLGRSYQNEQKKISCMGVKWKGVF